MQQTHWRFSARGSSGVRIKHEVHVFILEDPNRVISAVQNSKRVNFEEGGETGSQVGYLFGYLGRNVALNNFKLGFPLGAHVPHADVPRLVLKLKLGAVENLLNLFFR